MRDARALASAAGGMPQPGYRWLQPLLQHLVFNAFEPNVSHSNSLTPLVSVADLQATVAEPPRRSSRAPPAGDAARAPPPPLAAAQSVPKSAGRPKRTVASPGEAAGVSGLRPHAKRSQQSVVSTLNPPSTFELSDASTADPPPPRGRAPGRAGASRSRFGRATASVVKLATRLPESAAAALAGVAARGLRPVDSPSPAAGHGLGRSPLLSAAGTVARTLREVVMATQVPGVAQKVEVAAAEARAKKERVAAAAGAERKVRSQVAERQAEEARAAAQVEAEKSQLVEAQAREAAWQADKAKRAAKQAEDQAAEARAAVHRLERVQSATADMQAFAGDLVHAEQQRIEQVLASCSLAALPKQLHHPA